MWTLEITKEGTGQRMTAMMRQRAGKGQQAESSLVLYSQPVFRAAVWAKMSVSEHTKRTFASQQSNYQYNPV